MAHIPTYRKQKERNGKDRAFVEIDGVRQYLGVYDSPESRETYARTIAEWTSGGGHLPVEAKQITVGELAARYWTFCEGYYRKDGETTGELSWVRYTLQALLSLYKHTPATHFGPLKLKAVRDQLIKSGVRRRTADGRIVRVNLSRRTVNGRIDRIKRLFRWGTENELVRAGVYEALRAVPGLRKGRSEARETAPIRAVPIENVKAVQPFVTAPVAAMIQIQLHAGMRPGEVRQMRSADLDMSGPVWLYRPQRFKTQHLENERVIALGPKSQAIIAPFLKADPNAYLFATAQACYSKNIYSRANLRGCKWAGVPAWTPNQLRHTSGTMIRENAGLEGAQVWLGHKHASTSEIYAETNHNLARQLAAKHG